VHPEFIRIGPLDIHTYGVMVALGFMIGLGTAVQRARRAGIDPDRVADFGIWLVVSGMLGGKLFHVIFFWNDFIYGLQHDGLRSLRSGFVFYGGFIAASLTAVAYATVKRLPLAKMGDILAPSIALGHAFGRMGCFFNGCCYGKVCATGFPFGVRFPRILGPTGNVVGSPPFVDHLRQGLVPMTATASLPIHPTELYEVAGNLVIFAWLSAFFRYRQYDGQVWWLYVLSYGVLRFFVEFFRGDYDSHYFGALTVGQIVAMVMIAVSIIAMAMLRKNVVAQPA